MLDDRVVFCISMDMEKPKSRLAFLKDVLVCSLGAYGGPEAHISVFLDVLVVKRHYLSEEELVELVALCSICLLYTSPSPRDRG